MLTSLLCLTLTLTSVFCEVDPKVKEKKDALLSATLPPCAACEGLVNSFNKGLERTSRGKFEGGDTAWEEKNQRVGYANSEVRFVEIQEEICKDMVKGEVQCHNNHQEWEHHLEEWWPNKEEVDLRDFLCVETLKACCPEGHFGSKCQPCKQKGENGEICSGKGKCKGDGTRKGSGKCDCFKGYKGQDCSQCQSGYYKSGSDCVECDKSCQKDCSGPGQKSCTACRNGYRMDAESGCVDVDECVEGLSKCDNNTFCSNFAGSYKCEKCDQACQGCTGNGSGKCQDCAQGYIRIEEMCVKEPTVPSEEKEEL